MKEKSASKKVSKKQVREIIYGKLALALAEYKTNIKEKRFEASLKKASKLFADDVAKAANKANEKSKKKPRKEKAAVLTPASK